MHLPELRKGRRWRQGLELRALGLGSRVEGLGSWIQGLGFTASGLGFSHFKSAGATYIRKTEGPFFRVP